MSDQVPSKYDRADAESALVPFEEGGGWVGSSGPTGPQGGGGGGGIEVGRIINALLRFKWLIALGFVLGVGAAYGAYRLVEPEYRVEGAIWVNVEDPRSADAGPIAQAGLLEATAWLDLLESYAVLDPVVLEERLFIDTQPANRGLFFNFSLDDRFAPGGFVLEVTDDGQAWTLVTDDGRQLDAGVPGDPIGRDLGFRWAPPRGAMAAGMSVRFDVIQPRDAAAELSEQLQSSMDRQGNFIRLSLDGTEPERVASILQSVMERHVSVAADLKKAELDELTVILEEQLSAVQRELERAENDLESFRIQTITLPTEESAPIAPGIEQTRGPVFADYFNRRMELEEVTRDIERLNALLDSIPEDGIRVESFELIPAAQTSSQLQGALTELTQKRAELRSLLQRYTEDYQPVIDLRQDIRNLEMVSLPALTTSLVAELEEVQRNLRDLLNQRSGELQEIPPRAIEEARLERRVAIADRLYVDLRQRYETASLASASSIPDVRILDNAQVPTIPSSDPRLRFAVMAFAALFGLGIAGAVLLDHFDPRLRYLSDVSEGLGMEILGMVPRLRTGRADNSQRVFEAFRDIRMRVDFAHGTTRPVLLSITSPETEEGKTFVSANLAIAFSQLGHRTLVIDGDTRRGDLHELFDRERKPGLTDVLEGTVAESAIRATDYPNLSFLPCGSRRSASPEMLSSSRMQQTLASYKPRFDVIIVDCPPMAAGSDAFVLGAHTGNLVVVMRSGSTNKDLTRAKMEIFLRLPVRVLGGVLNDLSDKDAGVGYDRHYGYYLADYAPGADEYDGFEVDEVVTAETEEDEEPAAAAPGD
jgi:capsular exopolysaccharide synthesis family protein